MGSRLMKRLDKATSVYIRDAKGNTMSVYEVKTEKKDGDTDAQGGQKLESFIIYLYGCMTGLNKMNIFTIVFKDRMQGLFV
jgi:hypothetical protein